MEWLQVAGLCLDILGVAAIGWPVMFMRNKEAIELGLAFLAEDTEEENLRLPPVVALLRQRRGARFGFGLLFLGFAGQALGVIL